MPAMAHHSFATFDASKEMTIVGTVKEFQWTNPHTWIFLLVNSGESVEEWAIEGGALVGLKRDGWSKDSFKAGDKVSITIHPKRDGSRGGAFMTAITADGKTLGHFSTPVYTETAKPVP
jgi:hypothetical protein